MLFPESFTKQHLKVYTSKVTVPPARSESTLFLKSSPTIAIMFIQGMRLYSNIVYILIRLYSNILIETN